MESKTMTTCDFLVIGAGVIGISIARALKKQYPDCTVMLIEKENQAGEHASGRNSGVLHAGFYYSKDSLKAKFTKEGNRALTQYCEEKSIALNRCGKLVVTQNEKELVGLQELLKRGVANQIKLELISEAEAKQIEPRVKTYQQALFSPTTSSVNPKHVVAHLVKDAETEGVILHFSTKYLLRKGKTVVTNRGTYSAGYIVNAAGLYADKIARDFYFSENYRILPFKGLYLYANSAEKFRTHIYPVPQLDHPFLGVHVTITVDDHVKIGPTAIPAFWREQYQGLSRFNPKEALEILFREAELMFKAGFDFKRLAIEEMKKYNRTYLLGKAAHLAQGVNQQNYPRWGKPGIRAQLLNIKNRQLEMDFVLEGDSNSFHVLNAVSPAFTCSIPFADYVVQQIQKKVAKK